MPSHMQTLSACAYTFHDFDLAVALWKIRLVYANSVNPDIARLMFATQVPEGVVQINRDEKVLV